MPGHRVVSSNCALL